MLIFCLVRLLSPGPVFLNFQFFFPLLFVAYSKMGHTIWKFFRGGVAKIFKSLKDVKVADSEGSSDSVYHSSPNSVSPPLESTSLLTSKALKTSKEEKKERRKKKKRKMEALNLLAEASDKALQVRNNSF